MQRPTMSFWRSEQTRMSSSNSGGAPFTNEDPLSARSHDCGIVEAGLGNSFLYLGNSGANRGGEKIGT